MMARPKGSKEKVLTPQQVGAIVRGVRNGDSYFKWSQIYGVSTTRIRAICKRKGVRSQKEQHDNFKFKDKRIERGAFAQSFYDLGWFIIVGILVTLMIIVAISMHYQKPAEGLNTLVIYANDTAGNSNNSTVYFFVDTTHPQITIYSPKNTSPSYREMMK